jgi:hypothetical protein
MAGQRDLRRIARALLGDAEAARQRLSGSIHPAWRPAADERLIFAASSHAAGPPGPRSPSRRGGSTSAGTGPATGRTANPTPSWPGGGICLPSPARSAASVSSTPTCGAASPGSTAHSRISRRPARPPSVHAGHRRRRDVASGATTGSDPAAATTPGSVGADAPSGPGGERSGPSSETGRCPQVGRGRAAARGLSSREVGAGQRRGARRWRDASAWGTSVLVAQRGRRLTG